MNLEEMIKLTKLVDEAIEAGQTKDSLRKDLRDASVVIGALMGRLGLSEVLLTNEELLDEETADEVWFEWVPSGKWIRIKRK